MQIDWLHVLNFKNCEERELHFHKGINCLVGLNGRGKTNILDAIYYLCFTRSFLNTSDSQNIRLNEAYFMLEGKFAGQGRDEHIKISFKRGQKKNIYRNKKEYEKLADHIGLLPAVMVCPQHLSIITGGSEDRRRWLDMLLSQFDHAYLQSLISYQRILHQRNSLLKQMSDTGRWDEETLLVYDKQLAKYGSDIFRSRKAFVDEFLLLFNDHYRFITNGAEEVSLKLSSHLGSGENMEEMLGRSRGRDRALQYTTIGTHKDDLDFTINSMSIKKFGSQGQQKSFLMALKLGEHHYLSTKLNDAPLLMLDDLFDKLDENRIKQLLSKVTSENFGQVFITDTGSAKLQHLFTELGLDGRFYDI